MKIVESQKRRPLVITPLLLIIVASLFVGCDKLTGTALETALEQGADDAVPGSLFARLKAEKATCPKQINEHTVLKDVSLQGVDRIRYTYEVSESGRPEVNMLHTGKIRKEALKRAESSHLGPAIAEKGFGVDHFFEDADGKCLLWVEMTGKEYANLDFVDPNSVTITNVSFSSQPTEADREAMLAQLKQEQAKCPVQLNSHTSLKSITLKGKNRIKYSYVVTKDGLQDINMDMEEQVKEAVLERTKSTPLGESVVKLDMGVEHFYQDTDGKCMLWLQLTKRDFVGSDATPLESSLKNSGENGPSDPEVPEAAPTQLDAYIPDKATPAFGNPITPPGVQNNPYVK
ncbi:MAG: hypothetical protein AAGG48_01465 [Planctomycetota bacterium]